MVQGTELLSLISTRSRTAEQSARLEDNPVVMIYRKMEKIIESMQEPQSGIPVRTVKSFISKIPSVFTGASVVCWLMQQMKMDEQEALHLAHLLSAHGYIFPIDDHVLTVKNDLTYHRFQTPFLWPSNSWDPDSYDYAVYLCKRTMQNKQRLELADYEAESLARLQKLFSRKWEFVFMQAEAQARVDKKRDRLERKVLDSQERAFWDVHRPVPGCVNTTDVDVRKSSRVCKALKMKTNLNCPNSEPANLNSSEANTSLSTVAGIKAEIERLQKLLQRRRIKLSKVAESYLFHCERYAEFDGFLFPPEPSNPWLSDNTDFWVLESSMQDVPARRIKRWGFSLRELLQDPAGREHFKHFLEKEFSAENLKFWEICEKVKTIPQKDVEAVVLEIYREHLAVGACDPVNLDCRVLESVKCKIDENPDRYCLEEAQEHIFQLMKRDSYNRYIRLDVYKEFVHGNRRKSKKRFGSVRHLCDISGKINFKTRYSEI